MLLLMVFILCQEETKWKTIPFMGWYTNDLPGGYKSSSGLLGVYADGIWLDERRGKCSVEHQFYSRLLLNGWLFEKGSTITTTTISF